MALLKENNRVFNVIEQIYNALLKKKLFTGH